MQPDLFNSQKNVIVFIDGTNFLHSLYQCYRINFIDILALSQKLCGSNRNLKQVRYYSSNLIENHKPSLFREQQSYIAKLNKTVGIEPIEGGKYVRKSILPEGDFWRRIREQNPDEKFYTYIEKGLDVRIAVDLVSYAIKGEYDTAILISGDGDFVPVIEIAKAHKKKVQVAGFNNELRKCYDLKNNATSFMNLDHFIPSILKAKKP